MRNKQFIKTAWALFAVCIMLLTGCNGHSQESQAQNVSGGNHMTDSAEASETKNASAGTDKQLTPYEKLFEDGPILAQDENDLWGYIDMRGEWVIEPQFHEIQNGRNWYASQNDAECGRFVGGLAPAKDVDTGKWGYFNTTGEWAIEPKFNEARVFNKKEMLAVVSDEHDLYGYIDITGEFILPPLYTEAYDFNDGLGLVRNTWVADEVGTLVDIKIEDVANYARDELVSGLYGYVDNKGKVAIEPQYTGAKPFSSGRAFVTLDPITKSTSGIAPLVYVYMIDKGNDIVGEYWTKGFGSGNTTRWQQGMTMISLDTEKVQIEKDGGGTITRHRSDHQIIDVDFNTILTDCNTDYSIVSWVPSGYACALDLQTNLYGIVDFTGAWVVEPQYDGTFTDPNSVYAYYDEKPEFNNSGDYLGVCKDGHRYFIDMDGNTVIDYADFSDKPYECAFYGDVYKTFIHARTKDEPTKYGVVDFDGNIWLDFVYDKVGIHIKNGLPAFYGITLNGLQGYIDSDGNTLLEPRFKQVYS